MGFFDKVKTVAKNADSYAGETVDKEKYKAKIKSAENDIDRIYKKIGKAYYCKYSGTESEEDLEELCKKVDDLYANIEEYKAEIENVKEAGKKERADIKAEAEEKERREKEEKAKEEE